MPEPLRVLILDDSPSDAELIAHELRHAGLDPVWTRVDTEAAFVAALDDLPDVILADYSLPGFDGINHRLPDDRAGGRIGSEVCFRCETAGG